MTKLGEWGTRKPIPREVKQYERDLRKGGIKPERAAAMAKNWGEKTLILYERKRRRDLA